jgi:hypothetical protein
MSIMKRLYEARAKGRDPIAPQADEPKVRREFHLIDDGGIGRRVVMVEISAEEDGPDGKR